MKAVGKIIKVLASGRLFYTLTRRTLRTLSGVLPLSFGFLVETGSLERPAHAYCMWNAAILARELGVHAISVAEFGVAGGNTLLIIESYAAQIEKALGVHIQVYGFDTGAGMPQLEGAVDLPYWFQPLQYAMDVPALKLRLTTAELILGNVRDTVQTFFATAERPPLAAMFNDLDFFSSTRDAMRILDADSTHFLPRLFLYLDDVVGSAKEMYGPFNGQLAADDEFNRVHENIKIHLNQNLLPDSSLSWRTQIYYIHLFDHPRYSDYIGGDNQSQIGTHLGLHP